METSTRQHDRRIATEAERLRLGDDLQGRIARCSDRAHRLLRFRAVLEDCARRLASGEAPGVVRALLAKHGLRS